MSPARTLIYAFYKLTDIDRREIARKLRLLTCNQLGKLQDTQELCTAIVKAAVAKNKKEQLREMVIAYTEQK